MSSYIYVYSGDGASQFFAECIRNRIENTCDDRKYKVATTNSLTDFDDWENTSLLVVPGGHAGMMMHGTDELAYNTNQVAQNILKHSVNYWGICAGGILGSGASSGQSTVESIYNEPTAFFPTISKPMLKLWPGNTIAPLFPSPQFENEPLKDFKVVPINYKDNTVIPMAHIRGPGFLLPTYTQGTEVIGRYTNDAKLPSMSYYSVERTPTAIIRHITQINQSDLVESILHTNKTGHNSEKSSKIILTGCHPEINSDTVRSGAFKNTFKATNYEQQKLAQELEESDALRINVITQHLKSLEIDCKIQPNSL